MGKKGESKIQIGDRLVMLRYSTNALIDLEDALGANVMELADRFQANKVGLKEVRALVWAGLRGEFPALTLEGCGDIIDRVGLQEISAKASEAFVTAFAQEAEGVGNPSPGNPLTAGIGTR